eukprot:793671_1
MAQCGKCEVARKYLRKSYKINETIVEKCREQLEGRRLKWNIEQITYDECSYCGGKGKMIGKCSQCKCFKYCTRKCQKRHWKYGHRNECKLKTNVTLFDKVLPYLQRHRNKQQTRQLLVLS